jgi:hypothetical protein
LVNATRTSASKELPRGFIYYDRVRMTQCIHLWHFSTVCIGLGSSPQIPK